MPWTIGDWHGFPLRVLAQHRGARRKGKGSWVFRCMGLSAVFDDGPGPGGVGDVADDGLAAWIDVDMLDSDLLFAAPSQLGERINLSGEGPCQAMQREAVCCTRSLINTPD